MNRYNSCYFLVASLLVLFLIPRVTSGQGPNILDQWGVAGLFPGELDDLRDIAVDADGNVFLIDRNRLQKFTNDGTFVFRVTSGGDGNFSTPYVIAVNQNNEIVMIDSNFRRMQVFDNKGNWQTGWSTIGQFWDVAVGPNNEHYFMHNDGVREFSRDGDLLSDWISVGSDEAGYYWNANAFTVDGAGEAYAGEDVIQKFSADGEFLFSFELSNDPNEHVGSIHGIAVDNNGLIYTVRGTSIRVYDKEGHYLTKWESHARAVGITVGPDGNIYVADSETHQVTKYAPLVELPPPPPPPPPPDWYPEPRDAALILHIGEAITPSGACTAVPNSASEVVTKARASSDGTARYFVYILGAPVIPPYDNQGFWDDLPGMAGIQVGITYEKGSEQRRGIEVLDWTSCSDLQFPGDNWPESGSGNTITWIADTCDEGIVAAGYFYVSAYGPAAMQLAPFPPTGLVKTATCRAAESEVQTPLALSRVGWVSMGGGTVGTDTDGCNPLIESCTGPVPVRPTTWGQIKARYGN